MPTLRICTAFISACFAGSAIAQTTPVTNYGYNAASLLSSVTEANGQSHTLQYNVFGERAVHQQPNPTTSGTLGQVGYGYNGQGRVQSVSDPRSLTTSYDLEGLGRSRTLTSPDTGVATADFDEADNRTTGTNARGRTVTADFDSLNRPTAIHYGDSSVSFGYDAGYGAGQLTSMTDSSGSTTWTYDKLGRVTSKAQTSGTVTLTATYSYLAGGRISSITYPSGAVVGFTYDGANVASIAVNGVTAISGITYFPFGALKSWTMGAVGTYSRTADTSGRITSHTSETGTRTLTWDASSRLTTVAETGQSNRTYGYDNLNRLTSATESTTRAFSYDLTGNRTGETVNSTAYTYSVDSGSNRLTSSANDAHNRTYSYDAAGNTTSDGTRTFTYNDAGQLATATAPGGTAQYGYNGFGQRVAKTTVGGTRYYLYANDGVSLLGEYGATGAAAPVVETVYVGDVPVLALTGGAYYYILPDHLNTPRVIKSAAGAVVWRWQSDAFGNGAANESPTGGPSFNFNQRFPGQQFDAETGLHYNNARYYDPQIGRYITSDPLGLAGGINTFAYALGNPLNSADLTGLTTLNLIKSNDALWWNGEWHRRFEQFRTLMGIEDDNTFVVFAHGFPGHIDGISDPKQLLDLFKKNGYRDGMDIDLRVCNAGEGGKNSIAAKISHAAKARVLATAGVQVGFPFGPDIGPAKEHKASSVEGQRYLTLLFGPVTAYLARKYVPNYPVGMPGTETTLEFDGRK
jgi:RHS repeat-associated protein